jgi:hypothetical protein
MQLGEGGATAPGEVRERLGERAALKDFFNRRLRGSANICALLLHHNRIEHLVAEAMLEGRDRLRELDSISQVTQKDDCQNRGTKNSRLFRP